MLSLLGLGSVACQAGAETGESLTLSSDEPEGKADSLAGMSLNLIPEADLTMYDEGNDSADGMMDMIIPTEVSHQTAKSVTVKTSRYVLGKLDAVRVRFEVAPVGIWTSLTTSMAFVLFQQYPSSDHWSVTYCRNVNYFSSMEIDPVAREIEVHEVGGATPRTFSYEDCGIGPGQSPKFGVMSFPAVRTGALDLLGRYDVMMRFDYDAIPSPRR